MRRCAVEGKLDGERDTEQCDAGGISASQECRPVTDEFSEREASAGLFASRIPGVPWTLRDVILASVLFVPIGVGGSLGLGIGLARSGLFEEKILAVLLGSTLLPLTLIAGAWVFGIRRYGVSPELLGFRPTTATSLGWLPLVALAIGLSTVGVYALVMETLGIDILVPDQNLEKLAALDGIERIPTFAIVGVLAPVAEEVFFRGFLLAALVSVVGGLRGALVSSAIFSIAHLNVSTLFPIFVMGIVLSWLYLRTGSIWPPIVAHAAQNLLALTILEIPLDAPAAYLRM